MDGEFRTYLRQDWLHANRQQIDQGDYRDNMLAALIADNPRRSLRLHFECDTVRAVRLQQPTTSPSSAPVSCSQPSRSPRTTSTKRRTILRVDRRQPAHVPQ